MSAPLQRTAEPDEPLQPGDAELMEAVRSGDLEAYGLLYRRHAAAAKTLARQLSGSSAEADDLVAEAFAKLLDMLRTGGGPDAAFRAYLLTTLRNALYDRTRRDKKLEWSDDMSRHDPGVPWEDTAVAGLESSLAVRAFQRLPERWQTVLWHTEVEQESPAEVAPLLGLTPNGVAALAYRAREGLRQAYLQEHLVGGVGGEHRATVNRLGAWARGGLTARQLARVEKHLASCADCRALATELEHVNSGLRGVVAPLLLGTAAAGGYLASHTTPADAAASAAAEGAAGGGAAHGAAAGGTGAGGSVAGGSAAQSAGAEGAAAGGSAGDPRTGGAASHGAGAGGTGAGGTAAGGSAAQGGGAATGGTAGGPAAGGAAAGGTAAGGSAAQGGSAGGAVAGGSAGGPAAGGAAGAAAGGAAGGGGSALASMTAWVAGTHAGQVAAAAVAAVVIGGAVAVTHDGGPGAAGTPAIAATTVPSPGLPGPDESGGPTPTQAPSAGSLTPSAGPGESASGPTASGTPTPSASATSVPPPDAAAPALYAGSPRAQGALRVGSSGAIAVPIRSTGGDKASGLLVTLRLPEGITARAGSGSGGWTCTPGAAPTCSLDDLEGGDQTTLHVRVEVGTDAVPGGTISGSVRAGNGSSVPIPDGTLLVLA